MEGDAPGGINQAERNDSPDPSIFQTPRQYQLTFHEVVIPVSMSVVDIQPNTIISGGHDNV